MANSEIGKYFTGVLRFSCVYITVILVLRLCFSFLAVSVSHYWSDRLPPSGTNVGQSFSQRGLLDCLCCHRCGGETFAPKGAS